MKVKEVLLKIRKDLKNITEENYLESLLIIAYVLNVDKEKVYLLENEELEEKKYTEIINITTKRLTGYPLPYIFKRREFMALDFYIDEGVLIPRQETETLVEYALKFGCGKKRFLDIGCGSGVISVSLLYYCKNLTGLAIDISSKAIEITNINAQKFGVSDRLDVLQIDFMDLDERQKFDFVVSNPPYVKRERLKNLPYEPIEALDGGDLGFDFYPKLFKKSSAVLSKENSFVLFEIDPSIKELVEEEAKKYFDEFTLFKDLFGKERFLFAKGLK